MTASEAKARDAAERVVILCETLADILPSDVATFRSDVRTQWAVEMGLIRIGETINRIPASVLERFPDQPWRQIVAMRNFAAHQYDDLDPNRVWRTVTREVPALHQYLRDVVVPSLIEATQS